MSVFRDFYRIVKFSLIACCVAFVSSAAIGEVTQQMCTKRSGGCLLGEYYDSDCIASNAEAVTGVPGEENTVEKGGCLSCPSGTYGVSCSGSGTQVDCCAVCPGSYESSSGSDDISDCRMTVTLDKNGGSGELQINGSVAFVPVSNPGTTNVTFNALYGESYTLPDASVLTQTGYTFDGTWSSLTSCGQWIKTTISLVTTGTEETEVRKFSTGTNSFDSDRLSNLVACKTQVTPVITLNKNGGTGGTDEIYAIYGLGVFRNYDSETDTYTQEMTTGIDGENPITVPTRAGYRFQGYFPSTGTGATLITSSGNLLSAGSDRAIAYTEDKTWYAHWTQCSAGTYCDGNNSEQSCPDDYPNTDAGAGTINDCYRACTNADVANSSGTVNGGVYYQNDNRCVATACASGYELNNGTCVLSTYHCDAGKYYQGSTQTCQTCPDAKYCPGGDFIINSTDQGIYDCPAVTDARKMTSGYPSEWLPDENMEIFWVSFTGWATGKKAITECQAVYKGKNDRGIFNNEYVLYNSLTDKYDNVTGNTFYNQINPGYYGSERLYGTTCPQNSYMRYKTALPCPAGSYCPGFVNTNQTAVAMPPCTSTDYTYDETIGIYACPNGYENSAAKSASSSACYTSCSVANSGITNALVVTGNYYYENNASDCRVTTCGTGYTPNTSNTACVAGTGTAYTVNHYTKNIGMSSYALNSTDNLTGTTNATVTLANLKKTITGFTYAEGFAGTAATGTTKPSSGAVTTTTILANGTRVINLYYNRNSYTVTLTMGTGIDSVSGASSYEYGATVSIDAGTSTGYNWSKWTQTVGGATVSTTQNYSFTMGTNNVNFTANATPATFNITLNANGGNGGTTSVTATYNAAMPSATMPTYSGRVFAGYYDTNAATGGTQYYTNTGASAHTWDKTAATILYARWSTCGLYKDCSDGTEQDCPDGKVCTDGIPDDCPAGSFCTGGESQECSVGSYSAAGASECTPCQSGKTTSTTGATSCDVDCWNAANVIGWNTATWDSATNTMTNVCSAGRCDTGYSISTGACAASSFTVTLNANGGNGGTTSVTATYNAAMPSATMPTRTGYTFAGYYDTNVATGGTQYYTNTGASARTWDKTTATILYARWSTCGQYKYCGNGTEEDCPVNHYCEGGDAFPCPAGKVCTDGQQTDCPANSYCTGGTAKSCSSLGDGTYTKSDTNSDDMTDCWKNCSMAEHAETMSGRDYYGNGVDTCTPSACVTPGYHLNGSACVANQITINFADFGPQTVSFGGDIKTPAAPVKSGYVFKGWEFVE